MEILALGEKIKRKRKELDMTLKDLAGDRITPGQISLVESGRSNPSMDLLEYLAGALQTSVEYLMESEETQAEKISIYYEQVAESYILSGDYITGEKYIENALYYVEKYNLEYRKAKILYLRAQIYMAKDELTLAQQFFLSSNVIFIKNNNYEEIINTFLNLGKITLMLKAYHSANSYLRQAEKVYLDNSIGNDSLLGEIYYYMARSYFKTEDIGKAIDYSFLAKSKFEQVHNREEYAKTLLLISEEYNKKGDLTNAIKYSQKTLEVYKELDELNNISEIENNLGKLFYEFENIEESFKHYEISKDIRMRRKDYKIVDTLINICENYIKLKNISKCEEVLEEIASYIEEEDMDKLIDLNILWYRIYTIKEMTKEAEYILLDTYKLSRTSNLKKKSAQLAIMIGKFYIDNKRDFEAAKYLDEGVNIFKEIGILKN
ncbi:MAG: helix-turn-helix transcriptional regulator [Clostridium sp.]|uniref:helix-turn-helix transcriptional regulator n=1 Tax=Clostridium sp. TaxID=1506 RepID=UPI001EB53418|nr:helix-turn-helix transcriptional regulator [Clostridium sp.]MBS5884695.1 helix-turn-helix domain-containing protein [Clostridium sp.]MBS6503757.1 helix-turn-helix domain-containing protein [Clostridium sp.]MDU7149422.1 helix-turn-helix transcriptional regulator [Clostridium sp.]MDU7242650.1 helix-turn-helix transcriptional regulator [Clostridium sp.]